ncbi:nicotinate-nucleotide--dimethylbenzimidazole phosphoribosyltransferase [Streptomyces xantholiticus]|uniref:nicotinate-nucleotide--dimethylbenzimidazole phosphoribosyltransferase n=1 Tax=Streptomyces xantholiticus TaxID=68285 RepID=UPI001678BC59|nr:nicotinate-nucleotide--dimethylbenzimidazole phosphoribosyltransferase [Streptomyces xantholiticus]GGW34443.1 nicotinate-nucleotide--dimethylbenzimidazole phosphoribosyltransferase [Streptomyces xantholiticus]
MTDTGQIPGEGLPENAGMVEQPGVPAPGAYTYLDTSENSSEEDDLLLMPGAQGAWSEPQQAAPVTEQYAAAPASVQAPQHQSGEYQPDYGTAGYPAQDYQAAPVVHGAEQPPAGFVAPAAPEFVEVTPVAVPEPQFHEVQAQEVAAQEPLAQVQGTMSVVPGVAPEGAQAAVAEPGVHEPGAHEAGGRDSGAVDLGAVRTSAAATSAMPTPPPSRRPLHMGPPVPDTSSGVVRSLADRGPAGTPPHPMVVRTTPAQPATTTGVEYLDVPREEPAPELPGPQLGEIPPQAGAPWDPQPPQEQPAAPAETVVPTVPANTEATVPAPRDGGTEQHPPAPAAAGEPEATAPGTAPAPAAVAPETGQAPDGGATEVAAAQVVPGAPTEGATALEGDTANHQAEGPALTPAAPEAHAAEPAVVPAAAEAPASPVVQAGPAAGSVDAQSPEARPTAEPVAAGPGDVVSVDVQSAAGPVEVPSPEARPTAEPGAAGAVDVASPEAQPAAVPAAEAAEPVIASTAGPVDEQAPTAAPVDEQSPEARPTAEPAAAGEADSGSPEVQPSAGESAEATDPGASADGPVSTAPVDVQSPEGRASSAPAPEPEAAGTADPAPADAQPLDVRGAEVTQLGTAPGDEEAGAAEPGGPTDASRPGAADAQTAPATGGPGEAESPETHPAAAPAAPAPGYGDAEREAVLRVMRERRDIRNGFRSDPIPHEVLLRVLEAAHHAPSVGHSQPWDFVVIRSAETRRTMHELAQRQREAYAKSLPKARAKQFKELKIEAILDTPVNIVVTADPTRGGRHTLGRHTQPQMAPYSSALAVENLWLAARAEGLGVGWVSFFDEREMVRTLGLPEHLEVVAYLCVGYVDEFPEEPELMQAGWSKRRPLSWVVHEETYGRRALPGEQPHDLLQETVTNIRPLDAKALGEAWERQKRMTKPSGALGMLEIISAQLSGLSRMCPPPIPEPAAVAIFAGDHGVHAQGVTAWPQEVTGQMVANFLGGGAVCNAFANQVGAEVCVIDVGVASDLPATPGLLPRKVRPGTADFTTGPALTREEVLSAIEVGIETARDLVAAGNKALLTGEMGIANTTTSAALIAVYTGADPSEITGRGTGINDEMHARKVDVVRRALELHQPDPADPIGALSAVGGLEHCALVGLILGGASLRTPVILDGVSTGAAALVARAIAPEALAACIAGHRSAEPGHVAALNKLGLRPLVDLDLRLGEGTGALLALPLVQSAARAMHEVATFDSAGVTEK